MYKLFTKIITTRLDKKLDENQPREPAGFRSKYSTTDHIHAINQLKEKCREYNIPLGVAIVDYEKGFVLSVCLPACLPVCLSVCLPVCIYVCPSVCLLQHGDCCSPSIFTLKVLHFNFPLSHIKEGLYGI